MPIPRSDSMICTCLRCHHHWCKRFGRRPKRCPNCTQPNWDKKLGEVKMGRPKGLPTMSVETALRIRKTMTLPLTEYTRQQVEQIGVAHKVLVRTAQDALAEAQCRRQVAGAPVTAATKEVE